MAITRPGIGKASSSHKSRGELLQEVAQLEWRAAKLNQRSTLLQSALDAMQDGLAVFDANLQLVGWNRHFLTLVDIPPKTAEAGISALDLIRHYGRRGLHGDVDVEAHAREVFESLRGAHRPKRTRLSLPDGRTLEIRRSNLSDGGYLSVYTDVTDTTRIQQALVEKTGRLERVEGLLTNAIDSLPDGFQLFDSDDRLLLVNKAYLENQPDGVEPAPLGVRFSDIIEQRVRDGVILQAEGDPEGYRRDRLAAHQRADGEPIEQQLNDGRWMEIREQRTHVGGIVQFRRDITARKRTEEELARHRERLQELVEERSRALETAQRELVRTERLAAIGQLTGTVSHELRNPLGTIRSSFAIVSSHLQSSHGPVARALERIERNIDRCVTIIDELLAYTRVRDVHLEAVVIDDWLTNQVVDEDIPHGISVVLDCQSDATIFADRERLRRAILNVLQNAWQAFTESEFECAQPMVAISTRVEDGQLALRIADNGPGIPEDIRERIFDPLFSTKSFGVGLGLPLVRQIVDQHGGGISVDTTLGEGTTITITVPIGEVPALRSEAEN
ncbi:MAG: PAS-domain containing protein [Gammaproteobacteria bacterium]|nr:PAS-domain containing protein [Gammaproteobacteria bacterium]MDX2461292.1 PAS-domain containing protein [Gammaproteobacteria bacterium]